MSSVSDHGNSAATVGSTAGVAPDWAAIVAAHARIAPRIHRTPVLTSASLDAIAGARLFFKCDNFQKTGSFKIRGASNAILSMTDAEISRGIVTLSSGNHGAAVACAAAWCGVPAYIVMPRNAPKVKCAAVEAYGGRITYCEPTVSARAEAAARVQAETGAVLVHPYDDDRIIAGQATAAKELLEDVGDLDAVFAPVSGGGLLSGTCLGAQGMRPGIKIYGCEPERADDAYRSLMSGTLQALESSDTIADGLRASLSPRTFAILRPRVTAILLVSEAEIISATRLVWERMKIIIEPSCAVAVAPLLRKVLRKGAVASLGLPQRGDLQPPKLGIIFSGGNLDLTSLPF
ncbi:MAG TPA: pyridoxal-phosphate dependent enzyme [Candidatus Acidoferrum sp.]|nr:pyridoxal-phosphate dependent enzyme [Candidatus Acidoferrum sp.]